MKKIAGLDPFTLLLVVLLVGCAGALGYEGLTRLLQRPQPRATVPAAAPAPAETPQPQTADPQQSPPSQGGAG